MAKEAKYAIIRTGGKQYRVAEGDVIDVELLKTPEGEEILFEEVLFFTDGKGNRVGAPRVEGASVRGTLKQEIKGPKVIAYKYKRRQKCRRTVGHRQKYSRVEITAVEG